MTEEKNNPPIRTLYDTLIKDNVDLPDYAKFLSNLNDQNKAQQFYTFLKQQNYDVPDEYEPFATQLNIGQGMPEKKKEENGGILSENASAIGSDVLPTSTAPTPAITDVVDESASAIGEAPQQENTDNPGVSFINSFWQTLGYNTPAGFAGTAATGLGLIEKTVKLPENINPDRYNVLNSGKTLEKKAKKEIEDISKMLLKYQRGYESGELNAQQIEEMALPLIKRMNFLTENQFANLVKDDKVTEWKKGLTQWALERQEKGEKYGSNLTNTLEEIENPIDAINWLASTLGQTSGHILPNIATFGASGFGLEIGSIYTDAVQEIAKQKGISVEEVIEQGYDDPASALAFGTLAGALEKTGVESILTNKFKKELVKKVITAGGVEGLTEGVQTILEQKGVQSSTGKDKPIDWNEVKESVAQGVVGGSVMSVPIKKGNNKDKSETNKEQPHASQETTTDTPTDSPVVEQGGKDLQSRTTKSEPIAGAKEEGTVATDQPTAPTDSGASEKTGTRADKQKIVDELNQEQIALIEDKLADKDEPEDQKAFWRDDLEDLKHNPKRFWDAYALDSIKDNETEKDLYDRIKFMQDHYAEEEVETSLPSKSLFDFEPQSVEDALAQALSGVKLKRSSLDLLGDSNYSKGSNTYMNYTSKKDHALSLDGFVEKFRELYPEFSQNVDDQVLQEKAIELIKNNPNGMGDYVRGVIDKRDADLEWRIKNEKNVAATDIKKHSIFKELEEEDLSTLNELSDDEVLGLFEELMNESDLIIKGIEDSGITDADEFLAQLDNYLTDPNGYFGPLLNDKLDPHGNTERLKNIITTAISAQKASNEGAAKRKTPTKARTTERAVNKDLFGNILPPTQKGKKAAQQSQTELFDKTTKSKGTSDQQFIDQARKDVEKQGGQLKVNPKAKQDQEQQPINEGLFEPKKEKELFEEPPSKTNTTASKEVHPEIKNNLKNPSAFSNGDFVKDNYSGIVYEIIRNNNKQGQALLKNVENGTEQTLNAENNRHFVSYTPNEEGNTTYGNKNKVFTQDAAQKARELLKQKLGEARSGIDPEMMQAGITLAGYHIEAGARSFADYTKAMVDDLGESVRPYLRSWYEGVRFYPNFDNKGMTAPEEINATEQQANESATTRGMEPDRPKNASKNTMGQKDVSPKRDGDRSSTGRGDKKTSRPESGDGVRDIGTSVSGEGIDTKMGIEPGQPSIDGVSTRTIGSGRTEPNSTTGVSSDESTTSRTQPVNPLDNIEENKRLQEEAEFIEAIANDEDNIRKTLPMLLPAQQDDVIKAEKRFSEQPTADDPKKGMLFTNGTGTGKTFTGLGVAKRFEKMGKNNILIVVPTETKALDWQGEGKLMLMDIKLLDGVKDNGSNGPVATTYANFYQNDALNDREWDLIIYDESHKIMSNAAGNPTKVYYKHQDLANLDNPVQRAMEERYAWRDQYNKMREAHKYKEAEDYKNDQLARIKSATAEKVASTKVLFLSATPWAYHKNLLYGDGTLYRIYQGRENAYDGAYNSGGSLEKFFMENLGYRMRYNKLTQPEQDVNIALMERNFHEKLKKSGALSRRRLEVDKDYSRQFVLADSELGSKIDEGISLLNDHKQYPNLSFVIHKKFNFLYLNQLMEAIKAREMVQRVREHLELGRKVVVFHSYNDNFPSHPFDLEVIEKYAADPNTTSGRAIIDEINQFRKKHSEFERLDLSGLSNPIQTFKDEFVERVTFFNGTIPAKKRYQAVKDFNKDGSGVDIIVVQTEAGKEGISLHDKTGRHQRALIELGMPYKPTDAIQMEGRTYRLGVKTNAILEYPVLHLNFEKIAYSSKINERVGTAENFALGNEARNMRDAFKEGYKQVSMKSPSLDQGIGGKEADYAMNTMSEYDKAKTYYYSRQKRTAKTKSKEGIDYFATPEPLGYKMAEWLHPFENANLLEPSAGHGAIGRFYPENTNNTFIEPSYALSSDLSLNTFGKVLNDTFEQLHRVNKFDGIAMNPPYGSSSKLAWEHTEKALVHHMKIGGRVVTLVPQGPSFDKRMDKWKNESGLANQFAHIATIKLPSVTFNRAGTSVSTQILIFDNIGKQEGKIEPVMTRALDYSHITDINELFDKLEELSFDAPKGRKPLEPVTRTATAITKDKPETTIVPKEGKVAFVEESTHEKTGNKQFIVKMKSMLDYETEFKPAKAFAKEHKGTYYKPKKGFVFYDLVSANKLVKFINKEGQDSREDQVLALKSKGSTPLHAFNPANNKLAEEVSEFKLHERVLDIIRKYTPKAKVLQGYQGKKNLGAFFKGSKNLAVKSLSDVSVAFHELAHAIDDEYQLISRLQNVESKKSLKKVYRRFYPGATMMHSDKLQIMEGYACLIQKYIEDPKMMKEDFPDLVRDFIEKGKYTPPILPNLISDAQKMVEEYFALNPIQKIGARIVDDPVPAKKKSYSEKVRSGIDRVTEEIADSISYLESLAKKDGTFYTADDAAQTMRMANMSASFAANNIEGKKEQYWTFNAKGEWQKTLDYNWKTIYKRLKDRKEELGKDGHKSFGHYLVARRAYFDFLHRDELTQRIEKLQMQYEENEEALLKKEIDKLNDELVKVNQIIQNDGFSGIQVREAYEAGRDLYAEETKMYDAIMAEQLKLLAHPEVGIITTEAYNELRKKRGYASFQRLMFDEITEQGLDEQLNLQKNGLKVGSLMTRKGSEKPIINPFLSGISSEAEIIRKAMQQATINKIAKMAPKHPEVFQQVELEQLHDEKTGKTIFPQEKNPNIIVSRNGGKRQAFIMSPSMKRVIEENFTYDNVHVIFKVAQAASRLFRAGTTGWWLPFLATNIQMDQVTASANSITNMLPYISSVKEMYKVMTQADSEERKFYNEYVWLANTSQTSGGWSKQTYFRGLDIKLMDDSIKAKAVRYADRVADVITAPANYSEIMTRATEYIRARKQGYSQRIALEQAGRVSAPFHHSGRMGGKVGREYLRTIPYSKASIQVLAQAARTLSTEEGLKRYAFIFSAIAASSTAGLVYALNDDDDKEEIEALYTSMSPEELAQAVYIKNPFGAGLMKLRMPEQATGFSTLINMAILEHYSSAHYTKKEWLDGATGFVPDMAKPYEGTQWLMSITPHLLKGVTEVALNKKTYPEPRDIDTYYDVKVPSEERYDKWTSPTAILAGNTQLAKAMDMSPKKIDHLVGSYLGRTGQLITLKPNRMKFPSVFVREMYFESSRHIRWYYQEKLKNAQLIHSMENNNDNKYSKEEEDQAYSFHNDLLDVDDLMREYREINDEKEPKKSQKIRMEIFDKIKAMRSKY